MKKIVEKVKASKHRFCFKTLLILFSLNILWIFPAYAQGMGMKNHSSSELKQTIPEQISEIRSKLLRLETALEKGHQVNSNIQGVMANNMGMKKMSPMGKMKSHGMGKNQSQKMMKMDKSQNQMNSGSKMNGMGMMGMGMMGKMNKNSSSLLPSALPGFPGVSHIYHIGSTDFFLNHSDHIKLTIEQKTKLNQIKEQTTLDNSAMDRKAQQLEQDLWVLTSSDQPDIKKIDDKIKEIERQKGKIRLAFIEAVGKAAKVLSSDQLEVLKGMKHSSI